ncbi:MAG: DUF4199 domain-containing protein [Chitinophagales bacterium]
MGKYATLIKYGLIAGFSMIGLLMAIYLISVQTLFGFWTLLIYVVLIFCMIWGSITYRKEIGGFRNFGQAFVSVFIISITATLIFDTYSYLLYAVIDKDLPILQKQIALKKTDEYMERFGAPDDQREKTLKEMEAQDPTPTIKSQAFRMAFSLGIGAIFSLVIGGFVRRGDGDGKGPVGESGALDDFKPTS